MKRKNNKREASVNANVPSLCIPAYQQERKKQKQRGESQRTSNGTGWPPRLIIECKIKRD